MLEILKGYQAFTQVTETLTYSAFYLGYFQHLSLPSMFFQLMDFRFAVFDMHTISSLSFRITPFFLKYDKAMVCFMTIQACGVLRAVEPLNSFLASLCKFTINFPIESERRRY